MYQALGQKLNKAHKVHRRQEINTQIFNYHKTVIAVTEIYIL